MPSNVNAAAHGPTEHGEWTWLGVVNTRTREQRPLPTRPSRPLSAGLSDEHRMLIVLKSQLYGGQWEPMLDDLKNRLAGKPYIFKLVNRIRDDIERIETMRQFEAIPPGGSGRLRRTWSDAPPQGVARCMVDRRRVPRRIEGPAAKGVRGSLRRQDPWTSRSRPR